MKDESKIYLFEEMPIFKAVATLAIPTVIGSLVMVLYNLADTYFVGMINDPIETAAVTLAAPVLLAFNAVNNLFGVGCSSLMSRCLGLKDYKMVKQTSVFGIYGCIFSAGLFSLACTLFSGPLLDLLGAKENTIMATQQYMFWTVTCGAIPSILNVVLSNMVRSEGSAFHASIGTMAGCILNMILDPIFILPFGLNMKAAGAGCATFISNCIACLYFFIVIYRNRKTTYVCVNPSMFTFNPKIIKEVCKVGVPAMVQNLLNVTGMTILNNFTAVYGAEAVSAMGITHKINMIPMYITMGTGQGIMPLIGYNYAAKNAKRMKDAILFTAKFSIGFILVVIS
ncbi:MAG: polysaccharide biosynthesis C-terminal domain-containing protein, partial [Holdemanella sp.]|nr:polysaccharide biosynthesis C-terminal domain-containing protein [Holdemanella sp.]